MARCSAEQSRRARQVPHFSQPLRPVQEVLPPVAAAADGADVVEAVAPATRVPNRVFHMEGSVDDGVSAPKAPPEPEEHDEQPIGRFKLVLPSSALVHQQVYRRLRHRAGP